MVFNTENHNKSMILFNQVVNNENRDIEMFSYELIEKLKEKLGTQKDIDVVDVIPAMNKGNLSSVKSGRRSLTEEQALFIAAECGLNPQWVLVQLAEETSKSEKAKATWSALAKKLSRSAAAAILAVSVLFCGFQSDNSESAVFA